MESKHLIPALLLLAACPLFAQEKSPGSLTLFGDGKAKGPTIITATHGATFDSKKNTGTFVGSVQVQDPQFSLTCDRLTVQMSEGGGGLKQADADGNVFIVSIRKARPAAGATPAASPSGSPAPAPAEDEKSTGKGEHATYTTADGQIVLSGSPQIQQRGNTHIATDPGTVMRLFRDGRLQTDGPSRTIISNQSKAKDDAPK